MPPIIGRIEEQHRLDTLYQSQKAEFLAVYGRRRVGKTFLISQFFKNKGIYLEITGSKEASTREQLTYFYREFSALFQREEASIAPQNWSEAFHLLTKAFEKIPPSQKLVLFFDELPWLASPKSKFLSVLDYYWNRHFSKMSNILLIICGSAASWMIKKVIHHRGGLYGRLSYEIRLQPFSLSETRDFFRAKQIELSEKQIVEVYMVTGGIPKYLSYVEKGLSSMQVINALCFTPQGPLVKEFHKLYSSLFEDAYRHTTIIALLAKKRNGLLQKEIQQQAQIPLGGRFGEILEELEESGFIIPLSTYGKKTKEKRYRLLDEYSLFYLEWIDHAKLSILSGEKDYWMKKCFTPSWHTWAGVAFENICFRHINKIKDALGIGAVSTQVSYWKYVPEEEGESGAEIDLLLDRADHCIHLCEIKFYSCEYSLSKQEAENLERKKSLFIEKTKTKKTVFVTLITPFGALKNAHYLHSVQNQLTLQDLFDLVR